MRRLQEPQATDVLDPCTPRGNHSTNKKPTRSRSRRPDVDVEPERLEAAHEGLGGAAP